MAALVRAAGVASVSARGQQRRLIAQAQAGGLLLRPGPERGPCGMSQPGRGGKVVSRLRCCSAVGTCWTSARSPVGGGGHVVVGMVLLRFWSFSLITLAGFMLTSTLSTVRRFRLHQGDKSQGSDWSWRPRQLGGPRTRGGT